MSGKSNLIATKLKNFRETFIRQLPAKLEQIKVAYAGLDKGGAASKEAMENLHSSLHALKGVSANFGLDALSAIVTEMERLAKRAKRGDAGLESVWKPKLGEFVAQIEREIAGIDPSQMMDLQALEIVAAAETFHGMERKIVYLCESDSIQRLNLATQIGCFGFEVVSFGDLDQFRKATSSGHPDIIVMDTAYDEMAAEGSDGIRETLAGLELDAPVVFISSKSDIHSRLAALRAGSSAYFVKPVNITDLCTTLNNLTTRETPDPYRIMIVDDDPLLTEMTAVILQSAGMETRSLNDPILILPRLLEFNPDLILMDMYMPGCNGMELAKVIRQINTYFSIPIIFLSAETDVDTQFEARRMGGDEFLNKPIKPDHLISTVSVLAERMKIFRSGMVRDSMTGLLNYAATKDALDDAIKRSRNKNQEDETVCFATIDLDHFKEVNDNYGHDAGDRVLMALARLLRQRVRKGDVVGRTGGEEFAVVLPECTLKEAGQLLQKILEDFAMISFPVGENSFNSTYSCGVASLEKYDTVAKLFKAADEALCLAKDEGRNRVVAVGCG